MRTTAKNGIPSPFLLLAALAAGCGSNTVTGPSYLLVTVQSEPMLMLTVTSLKVTVTLGDKTDTVIVKHGDSFSVPPDETFALKFAPGRQGMVKLDAVAVGAGGNLAHGSTTAMVGASATTSASVRLGGYTLGLAGPTSFMTPLQPQWVATADFDGDGKLDLVTANTGANNVSFLKGTGDGKFAAHVDYATGGAGPRALAVADFNGDARLDLAVTNSASDNVAIMLGDGTGKFAAQMPLLAVAGTTPMPEGIVSADFNMDGNADLAVATTNGGKVVVFLGNGKGAFSAAPSAYGVNSAPTALAAGDMNGDGRPDLVVSAEGSNSFVVLIGMGSGTFQDAFSVPYGNSSGALALADLNGDGKQDVVIANLDTPYGIAVLFGMGDGTAYSQPVGYGVGMVPLAIALADLNGDAKLDVIVANKDSDSISVLLGNGDGSLKPQQMFPTGGGALGHGPFSIATGDFNGDGKPDLAVADYGSVAVGDDGSLSVFLNSSP